MAHSASHPLTEAGFVSPALSQRAVMFAGIVAFHVVLVYVFASGLAVKTVKLVFEPVQVIKLKDPEQTADTLPPPPPPPVFDQPHKIDLGPVPDPVPWSGDSGTALTETPTVTEPQVAQPPPRVEPIHLVGKHQLPNTMDYYPPTSRRLGVEGTTNVSVCVDERGKRTGKPTVTQSSGDARLDEGALQIARAGKYARSARGDTFVPNCYAFKMIFKIEKQ